MNVTKDTDSKASHREMIHVYDGANVCMLKNKETNEEEEKGRANLRIRGSNTFGC